MSTGWLQEILSERVAAWGLPGASAAVLHDGHLDAAAAGVLNVETGVEATTDALFEIGSTTKVYTATLVMQLVDAGLVALDVPVRRYVPEFRVADEQASDAITVRHLLTHTSGFDGGDYFFDGGRGDDTLQRCVASLAQLGQISPPGALASYNNAGFAVLGRLVELVTGRVWDDALRERLLEPAGLEHSVTLPEHALRFRVAAGHRFGADGTLELRTRSLHRTAGPAGGLRASASDVAKFARLHLEGGRGVLSPSAVELMQQRHAAIPGSTDEGFGLSWFLLDAQGMKTIGHNGGTLGQLAFLAAYPAPRVAVALLTNGPTGTALWGDIAAAVSTELGLPSPIPVLPRPPATPVALDSSKYTGTYARHGVRHSVTIEDDLLTITTEYASTQYDLQPPPPMAMFPVDTSTFVALRKNLQPLREFKFLDFDDDGRPHLLFAARLARRVG